MESPLFFWKLMEGNGIKHYNTVVGFSGFYFYQNFQIDYVPVLWWSTRSVFELLSKRKKILVFYFNSWLKVFGPADINFPKVKKHHPTILKKSIFIFDNGFLIIYWRFSNVTANSHRRQCVTTKQIVRRGSGALTTIIIGSSSNSSNSIINIIIIASRVQNK